MKKYILKIATVLTVCLAVSQFSVAQQSSLRDRLAKKKAKEEKTQAGVPSLSVRAEKKNELQTQDVSNAKWVREVYREIDLNKGPNAALLYPVEPIGDRANLFTMIFLLMAEGSLEGYEFLDGREVFTDQYKVDFKDVLERLSIPYEKSGDRYTFNLMDLPVNEALGYYVKEAWYFDDKRSVLDIKIIAICPVLYRADDFDVPAGRYPQFWIPYENIRPYAMRMPIMTSDLNNATSKTVDDYFKLRLYSGEIYKTTNMANKVLKQIYENEFDLKEAQENVEKQLVSFGDSLWVINNDSIQAQQVERQVKEKKKNEKKNEKKNKKAKKKKSKSSSSQPKFSARDRR